MKTRIILFFLFVCFYAAQAQNKKLDWDYPIKPGSEEWRNFNSMDEVHTACQIPEHILKAIDTESLVEICHNYPVYMFLFAFNSPQDGFDAFYSNFNGVRELFSREDVGHYMLKKYQTISMEDISPLWRSEIKGAFVFKTKFFEITLAQDQVIQSLEPNERKLLLKDALGKLDVKISNSDLFGKSALSINTWLLAKILSTENRLQMEQEKPSLKSGQISDGELQLFYQQAKAISDEG
jgi:hypothetical protein